MFGPRLKSPIEYDMVTGIIQNLRDSPRLLYGLLLTMCVIGELLVTILTYQLGSLPVTVLPAEYWLYSGIGVIFLFGFFISLASLVNPRRGLATTMASLGIFGLLASVCGMMRMEWTGNMAMFVVITCLSFAIALGMKLRDRKIQRTKRF